MLIHLVRHGCHSEVGCVLSGRSDIGLDAAGHAQAARAASVLSAGAVATIKSSPRRRALETAWPIAQLCGVSVETSEALDEIDFGEWTGRTFAALADDPAWQLWNSARASAHPPGGETMRQVVARADGYIAALASVSDGPVVLVSHCDVIRGIVAHTLGLSLDRMLAFDVDPGSVSTLSVGRWGSRVVALNGCAA